MKFLLFLLLFLSLLCGDSNYSLINKRELNQRLEINLEAIKSNAWYSRYINYQNFQDLSSELERLRKELALAGRNNTEKIDSLNKKIKSVSEQIEILKEFDISPIITMLQPTELEPIPKIHNPLDIITGYSQIRHLQNLKHEYYYKIVSLDELIKNISERKKIFDELYKNEVGDFFDKQSAQISSQIADFLSYKELARSTYDVYEKKINEQIAIIKSDVTLQIKQAFGIFIAVVIIFLVSLLIKRVIKKYIYDNDKIYMTNKIINFTSIFITIFIVMFAYIENVGYFVTILGFASAGLAIAMKDMFMSLLGWSVITFGGTLHVGDRIRVKYQNENIVGDIIDISLLRITIFEDITYTTWKENRRAGRVVFIPNNYIFTETISNYSHGGMLTVWDGIDFLLTFDSDHEKAVELVRDIVTKYAQSNTNIAKQQMIKLKNQYNIKNTNTQPRIFCFFEPYGIQISVWYMTNSFATLALRSTISSDILKAFKKHDNINISYPSQVLYHKQRPISNGDLSGAKFENLF